MTDQPDSCGYDIAHAKDTQQTESLCNGMRWGDRQTSRQSFIARHYPLLVSEFGPNYIDRRSSERWHRHRRRRL